MDVINTIKENKLIITNDIIGVGVSGGSDSMALLHYLNSIKDELHFKVIALNVDHSIRETSERDTNFVNDYCKNNNIPIIKIKIDIPKLAEKENASLEECARKYRYKFFEDCVKKGLVNKIALAHHLSDQCETILMHILRGSGLSGARGMEIKRDIYIRPFLNVEKQQILAYIKMNNLSYVTDETNLNCEYTRNFIRNKVMPLIKEKYENAERAIYNFGNSCKEDEEYIESQINDDGVLTQNNVAKIPLSYFIYPNSIISRIIFKAMKKIGITHDVERQHITLIKDLSNKENGSKIDLPNKITVYKEYEYISIVNNMQFIDDGERIFKCGKINFPQFGEVTIKKAKELMLLKNCHLIDSLKLPKDCVWRYKKDGDKFTKFGSGEKKLKAYFIDNKIPSRLREYIPVLAKGNEIYVVLGMEISDKVKIDKTTKNAYIIDYSKINNIEKK
jgi:tRNA(Ile)-lysidine synthase